MSLLASVAVTVPVTTPVPELGVPTVEVPATGATLDGLTGTLTVMLLAAPYLSVTVTVNVSAVAAVVAPVLAAAWRAVAVGV